MGGETESELPLADPDDLRDRLADAGARPLGRVIETNRFFDRPDGALRREGIGLRLRSTRPTGDAIDGPATLTVKGPRPAGATDPANPTILSRPELETTVGDPAEFARILETLGYVEILLYQKRRESWILDACRIELDDVPVLGRFVEVEGPAAAVVAQACARLGLDPRDGLSLPYLPRLLVHVRRHGLTPPHVLLPSS